LNEWGKAACPLYSIFKVGILHPADERDIETWRFAYWIERNLLTRLNHKKKTLSDKKAYRAMESYFFEINNGTFFTETIVAKIDRLYSIFQRYPHLTAKCGNELMGNPFEDDCEILDKKIYRETFLNCEYTDIQISTYIEHRARLAILKNAIEYKLYKEAGFHDKADHIFKLLGHEVNMKDLLPPTFKSGLDELLTHEYCFLYPVFWQWFLWVFGGVHTEGLPRKGI
jgi:hypothetical protein